MNNKIFIPSRDMNAAVLDDIRINLESHNFFSKYGDPYLSEKKHHYGFATVVPDRTRTKFNCLVRMLGCSYIYLPCGWQYDNCATKALWLAEFFGKKVIFEEDGRCR